MAQAKWSTISFEKQVGRLGSVCNCDCDSVFYSQELNVYKVKKEVKCVLTVMLTCQVLPLCISFNYTRKREVTHPRELLKLEEINRQAQGSNEHPIYLHPFMITPKGISPM